MAIRRWKIVFVSGRERIVYGFRVEIFENVLRIRTSHDTSYRDDWECFPLANVESYGEATRRVTR